MAKEEFHKKPAISKSAMFFILATFALVTFAMLAHVFLRFTIRDLRIETVRLQGQSQKMKDMEKDLIWKIEKLKQGDRLHEYACKELGLVDVEPTSIERLEVPASIIAKYSTGGKSAEYGEVEWAEARYPDDISAEMGSFIRINRELTAREQTLEKMWKEAISRKEKPDKQEK